MRGSNTPRAEPYKQIPTVLHARDRTLPLLTFTMSLPVEAGLWQNLADFYTCLLALPP